MVHPSPVLCSRLRFTTKKVGFGFYRGNRTGSVGAHTQYGGYVIDWRKVRNYNVPDLKDFTLTPYVTREIHAKETALDTTHYTLGLSEEGEVVPIQENKSTVGLQKAAAKFLHEWKKANPDEYDREVERQQELRENEAKEKSAQ